MERFCRALPLWICRFLQLLHAHRQHARVPERAFVADCGDPDKAGVKRFLRVYGCLLAGFAARRRRKPRDQGRCLAYGCFGDSGAELPLAAARYALEGIDQEEQASVKELSRARVVRRSG